MWVSRRTDYATRAILALSLEGGGPLKLEELARRTSVPQSVLEQVMPTMRTAGIVRSERGPSGGYRLNKDPEEISARAGRAPLPGPARADQLRDETQPRAVPDERRLHAARRLGGGARRDDHAPRRRDVRGSCEARRRSVGRSGAHRARSEPCDRRVDSGRGRRDRGRARHRRRADQPLRAVAGSRTGGRCSPPGRSRRPSFAIFTIGLPVIAPTLRDEFDLSLGQIGLLLAAPWIGATLTLLPWGLAADRFGERVVLALGLRGSGLRPRGRHTRRRSRCSSRCSR